MRPVLVALLSMTFLMWSQPNSAICDPITAKEVNFDFDVLVTESSGDLTEFFGRSVSVGETMKGSLRYDPATPPDALHSNNAIYLASAGSLGLGASSQFSLESLFISVENDVAPFGDSININAESRTPERFGWDR